MSIQSDTNNITGKDSRLIIDAIRCFNAKSRGFPLTEDHSITLNFHPDALLDGVTVVSHLVNSGVYKNQFETGTSSGSLSSHAGGKRRNWESELFCGVYDAAPAEKRPKYGALNYRKYCAGAAPRFGSAHLRLQSHVLNRSTFAYPDSHLEPVDFGSPDRFDLIALAEINPAALEPLDNYIEAHVHGQVWMESDVDAIVLDPCFQGTVIEAAARSLPFAVEWHHGFSLSPGQYENCVAYRGKEVADFIDRLSTKDPVTAASLTMYRDNEIETQLVKKAWHCIARFGGCDTDWSVIQDKMP